MNLETIIVVIAILGTYIVLVCCIRELLKQVAVLHQLLRETTREYKIYQASVNKDYKTVGVLRNSFAGGDKEPIPPESEKEESKFPETIITQHG